MRRAGLGLIIATASVASCGGTTYKASDPEIVSKAEAAVKADAEKTLTKGGAPAGLFSVDSISCKPFSDRQLDCTGVLHGPSGGDQTSGWRATVDSSSGKVTVVQKASASGG